MHVKYGFPRRGRTPDCMAPGVSDIGRGSAPSAGLSPPLCPGEDIIATDLPLFMRTAFASHAVTLSKF
jgi:hypothetical protein